MYFKSCVIILARACSQTSPARPATQTDRQPPIPSVAQPMLQPAGQPGLESNSKTACNVQLGKYSDQSSNEIFEGGSGSWIQLQFMGRDCSNIKNSLLPQLACTEPLTMLYAHPATSSQQPVVSNQHSGRSSSTLIISEPRFFY